MSDRYKKGLIILVIVVLVGLFFAFDLQRYLTLSQLQDRQAAFSSYYADHRLMSRSPHCPCRELRS